MTLVYIGAGLNIQPLRNYTNIKDFIYIDQRPFTNKNTNYYDNIIDDFCNIMKKEGFIIKLKNISFINSFYIEYQKNDIILQYHFNSVFPKDCYGILKNKIIDVCILGDKSFLNYIEEFVNPHTHVVSYNV